jgi:hydrogenase maturation protease
MTRVRIIGVGSPAGDDQVGWRVVEALQASGALERLPFETDAVTLDRPGAELIRHLQGADGVVVIDAIKSGKAPGTIHRIDDVALPETHDTLSSHGFGVASAFALGRALDMLPASWVIYGIEIEEPSYGSAPSPAVAEAAAALAEGIATELSARWGVAWASDSFRPSR